MALDRDWTNPGDTEQYILNAPKFMDNHPRVFDPGSLQWLPPAMVQFPAFQCKPSCVLPKVPALLYVRALLSSPQQARWASYPPHKH